jgi:hypothetical protein
MAKITGGGILGNKNVKVGVRTGSASKGSSPGAASHSASSAQNVAKADKLTLEK